jgi:hypothetical protein
LGNREKTVVVKEQEVIAFLAGLEDFHHPILNIIIMVFDKFHKEHFYNNNCHLEFLSIAMQLLHKAVSLEEINCWFASKWVL